MNPTGTDEAGVKKLAQALVQTVRALEPSTWRTLTELLMQLQCRDESLEFVHLGMDRFPNDAELLLLGGRMLAEAGDLSASVQALRNVLAVDPHHVEALWLLADLSKRQGDMDQARMRLSQLLHVKPDHEEARQLLRSLSAAPAVVTPAPAKKTFSTATLAEIYVKQGYLSKALQVYEQLLDNDPGNEKLRQRVEQLRVQMGAEKRPTVAEPAPVQRAVETVPEPQVVAPQASAMVPHPIPEPTPAPVVALNYEERILKTFENWLSAISQRRTHVH